MTERQRKILRDMAQDAEAQGLYEQPEAETVIGGGNSIPPDDRHQYEIATLTREVERFRQALEEAAEDIRKLPVGWHILMPIVHKIDKVLGE